MATHDDTLTDDQKKFLEEAEELFKTRFTDEDEEFMKIYNKELSDPPIVENYNVRPQRDNWNRGNRRNFDSHRSYDNRNQEDRSRGGRDYERQGLKHRHDDDRSYHNRGEGSHRQDHYGGYRRY